MTFYILRSINKLIKEKIKRHLSCIYLQVDEPSRNNPSIAQLVERGTVGEYQKHVVDIPRSLVQLRVEGILSRFAFCISLI